MMIPDDPGDGHIYSPEESDGRTDWPSAIAWAFLLSVIALLVFFGFWWALTVTDAHAAGADPKLKEILGPTVFINVGDGSCTGQIIYSDRDKATGDVTTLILSAKHCTEGVAKNLVSIQIPVYDKTLRKTSSVAYPATLRGSYYKGDLALFELQDKTTYFPDVTKLAPKDVLLEIGEPVWSSGYPLGGEKTITEGMLGARETRSGTEEFLRATPDIAPGNSGGGLYHKNAAGDFELIGVTVLIAKGWSFYTGSVPIDVIQDYLAVALPKPAEPTPTTATPGGPK